MAKPKLARNLQDWIEARKRHHLSHAHVQMARELGMNPRKLGKLDNHNQEPWKAPLPDFIEHLYLKRFGKGTSAGGDVDRGPFASATGEEGRSQGSEAQYQG